MDAIEPSNYEQSGWSDLTYNYVQSLRTALDAANARADAAEAALKTAREEIAAMRQNIAAYNDLMQRITDAGNYVHPDRLAMAKGAIK